MYKTVSNAKIETVLLLQNGIGRFEEEASFATEGVVTYVESSANGGRKRP